MAKSDHKLTKVKVGFGRYTAECTCRKWIGNAESARALKKVHKQHVQEFK